MDEFSDIGSVKVLLSDARERIKESEDRSSKKIEDVEKRLNKKIEDVEDICSKDNEKIIEWMPLMSNITKAEETKRSLSLLLIVIFISNVASWILTIFIYFMKSGIIK